MSVYSCTMFRWSKEASDVHVTHQLNSESHGVFEPHYLFVRLLEIICWDHMVLLDFVSSPETCALIYFTRYLQCVLSDWSKFDAVCQNLAYSLHPSSSSHSKCVYDSPNRVSSRKRTFSADSGSSDACWSSAVDNKKKRAVWLSTNDTSCLCVACDEKPHSFEHCCVRSAVSCMSMSTHHNEIVLPNEFHSHSLVDYSSSSNAGSPENNGFSLSSSGSPKKDEFSSSNASNSEENDISNDLDCSESGIIKSCTSNADTGESVLDKTMSFLIRFRLAIERLIEKKLFPYNIRPLLKLLTQCEYLYDET